MMKFKKKLHVEVSQMDTTLFHRETQFGDGCAILSFFQSINILGYIFHINKYLETGQYQKHRWLNLELRGKLW